MTKIAKLLNIYKSKLVILRDTMSNLSELTEVELIDLIELKKEIADIESSLMEGRKC